MFCSTNPTQASFHNPLAGISITRCSDAPQYQPGHGPCAFYTPHTQPRHDVWVRTVVAAAAPPPDARALGVRGAHAPGLHFSDYCRRAPPARLPYPARHGARGGHNVCGHCGGLERVAAAARGLGIYAENACRGHVIITWTPYNTNIHTPCNAKTTTVLKNKHKCTRAEKKNYAQQNADLVYRH